MQDDGGAIPGINYRAAFWYRRPTGHTGHTTIYEGATSYVTGSHSSKFGIRYHKNDSTFPKNYYNDSQLKVQLQRSTARRRSSRRAAGAVS